MKISVQKRFFKEYEYTFLCLLDEFIGIPYDLELGDVEGVSIDMNSKSCYIPDTFFREYYHTLKSISNADKSTFLLGGHQLPIVALFGEATLATEGHRMTIGFDLLGASFYMLSRYEEYRTVSLDQHDRFAAKSSLAYQHNFLDRPIVNEYVDLLKAIFRWMGYQGPYKQHTYQNLPTHDIDYPLLWTNRRAKFRSITGAMLRGQPSYAREYMQLAAQGKDPYDTNDLLMEIAERHHQKAHFFYLINGSSEYDGNLSITDPRVLKQLDDIKSRGHIIGLHPSYESFDNPTLFTQQKLQLETVLNQEVKTGRQHFLRFEHPTTWQMWSDAGMTWDSTLGYADHVGFRCGTCYEYPVFNLETREILTLRERPLLIMDTTLMVYQKVNLQEGLEMIRNIQAQVKKHNGLFVFLWHNSSIYNRIYRDAHQYLEVLYS